ncbi:hypothetical protein C1N60_19130 [Pantoea sp. SGAir0184]
MPRGRPHLTSNFPMISRGSSYPEENDRDIRGAIHGERTATPEATPIIQQHVPCRSAIHGDRTATPEATPIIQQHVPCRGAIHGDRMAAPASTPIIQQHIPCRVAIHGDRMAAPESTSIIHGDLMTFPEPDSHSRSHQAKSSIYAFH